MTSPRELCRASYSLRPKIFDVLDFDIEIILRRSEKDVLEKENCVLGE